jgi:flagellar basal-body rod modification protein FlgD
MAYIFNTVDPALQRRLNDGAPTVTDTKPKSTSDELQENFMTMLVTQLRNQDPLNPVENQELTSHLAQINTVSGIDKLNTTLSGITTQIETGQTLQAAALIGKGVLVPGERILVGEDGTSTPFGIELEQPAKNVVAHVVDGAGQVVATRDLGPVDAGVTPFAWDGTLDAGGTAPAGAYQVQLTAVTEDDTALSVTALNYALVAGISTNHPDGPRLDLGGIAEQVKLSDIRQIL